MINSIEVINYLGESEVFELARPEKLGLAIKNIDGLGPGKANINTTAIASYDGSVFDTARLGNRNIVITFLLLQYENTIEQARLTTYKYFPIKKEVTLIFHTDSRDVSIKGKVESNEPNIFSKDEETKISIICPDPYFYDLGFTKQSFSTLSPLFEFPFECDMGNDKPIIFGNIEQFAEGNIVYTGDADTGVIIRIHALGTAKNITIFNLSTSEQFSISDEAVTTIVGSSITAGDDIEICTMVGQKSITLSRAGTAYNILNAVDKNSDWFMLKKGDNIFSYTIGVGETSDLQFVIESNILYEGI